MDAGRVISDVAGFAGGIMALASPAHAALGRSLMGFSYAVDAISHAYRGLNHAGERIKYWTEKAEADKRKQGEEGDNPKICAVHQDMKAK